MSIEELFEFQMEFAGFETLEYENGHFEGKISVNKSDTNLYGFVHGGYLFTLCDNAAGLVTYSLGYFSVSMSSSISYFKPVKANEVLKITADSIHAGKKTTVVESMIFNQAEELICKAVFTMFNTAKVDENK